MKLCVRRSSVAGWIGVHLVRVGLCGNDRAPRAMRIPGCRLAWTCLGLTAERPAMKPNARIPQITLVTMLVGVTCAYKKS
jgi:hypothetical protein